MQSVILFTAKAFFSPFLASSQGLLLYVVESKKIETSS